MNSCLKSAQKSLCIQAVNLKESKIHIKDEIDIENIDRKKTSIQSFRGVDRIKVISSVIPESEEEIQDYRFIYAVGVRLIFSSEREESTKDGYEPILEIVGVFEARYLSKAKLDEDELGAFSNDNVGYHVWPYWREYVQSTCARIGFSPAFEVPVYIVAQRDEETDVDDKG